MSRSSGAMTTSPGDEPESGATEPVLSTVDRWPFPPGIWKDPRCLLAFGFGAGAASRAPGTVGTVVGIPLYVAMAGLPAAWYVVIVIALFVTGVWVCAHAERKLGTHDHPGIVWDEIVGYLVTLFLAPLHWSSILGGFVLFRLFDIWKPFPIRALERRIPGGLGTMLDDVLAGLYGFAALQLSAYLLV
jgi:phosphatidylglycerophosphatase A